MTKIKIICGTYGYRPEGSLHPIPVDRGSTCEVSEEEAQRLYRIGVACPAPEDAAPAVATHSNGTESRGASVDLPTGECDSEGEVKIGIDPEQLKELTNAKLRELAEDIGINASKLKTKAQLIAAIANVPLEDAISEDDDESGEDDGEEPPALDVEGPVV